ncbi:uncharacterized protein PGTG_08691 [Puccinia graminis f. sp. tritici CRL 75-36-700-3]|uniref:Reverse transcriptase domain-containing protein n=1 Tax=Puccinia graminis f. sp. tritici (strain CRL 75-36-700-3 / race SCCL) TaxID=418459 RepID=E3KGT0_PUCGT|nr:uncharacterized protein PGTG_08691 [Puccinia graminis f. sp. tritici CRL 75-36-700-3]EFP83505.2 hypothetical protein PGTG_08691 [Puccinia graminis f. sp. tritici CRL 75-36-700-3]
MSTNPNNLQSTANQMRRNNADLTGENAATPAATGLNPSIPPVPSTAPIPPSVTQSTTPVTSQTPNPIVPIPSRPKNPAAAKAPTGSASHTATTKPANQPSTIPKHSLSLDEVAANVEKQRQVTKQSKEIAAILGAKTIDVEKAYAEKTIAAKAARKREADRDEETALILEKHSRQTQKATRSGPTCSTDLRQVSHSTNTTHASRTERTATSSRSEDRKEEHGLRAAQTSTGVMRTLMTTSDAALTYHAEKHPKTDDNSTEKGLRYTGLPYPSEWCMSYSDWSLNYAEFTTTMRDVYKYKTLGEWIVLHKANADKILRKDGFMVALRYDIRIRANAFAHRVVKNGVKSFSDISIFRQEVYDTAYAEARSYDELVFREVNPYAIGGVRASWDPHTGSKSTTKSTASNPTSNHHTKNTNPQTQSGSQGPSHLPAKPRESLRGSGYQGKNYNPNHSSIQSHSSGRYHNSKKDGEWEAALANTNLMSEFEDVLRGFKEGFHQGIPAQPKIEESISKEIKAGRMFGPYTTEQVHKKFGFFQTNPLGAVVNGDGSLRAINDLSFPHGKEGIPSVNSFVNKEDFDTTWDDFKAVAKFLRNRTKTALLAIFDWEKAYRQIPTAPSQWPYLMLQNFKGEIIVDTRIAFGGVAGCGSFGRPADAWKHIMLAEFDLVTVFRWVDDNLFVKELSSTVEMDDIVARSNELGVKTNPTKISPFRLEQKYIGFIWNAAEKTVRLPEEKTQARIKQIQEILTKGEEYTYKQIEIMTGRLNHVSYMLPQLRCYLCSLYRMMNEWVHRHVPRPLPLDARQDMLYWLKTLLTFDRTRLIANPEPTEIGWVGDASTSYGIGVLIGKRWAQFKVRPGWNEGTLPRLGIAWMETAAIRIGLLMMKGLDIRKGKTIIVWTDNTTSEDAVKSRKSKDLHVNEEWKRIQDILLEMQIDLVAKRVTSKENKADGLSRGDRRNHLLKNQVVIDLPSDLEGLMFQASSLD